MKMELDSILNDMYVYLGYEKEKNKDIIKNKMNESLKIANDCLKKMSDDDIKFNHANKELIYECEKILNDLKGFEKMLMKEVRKYKFEPSTTNLDESFIGTLMIKEFKEDAKPGISKIC